MDDEANFTCAGCRRNYPVSAWRNLRRIRILSGADVHRHVLAWPERRVVEVRACERCGHAMARTARQRGGDVDDDAPGARLAGCAQASALTLMAAGLA